MPAHLTARHMRGSLGHVQPCTKACAVLHVSMAVQDMGHRLDAAAPVQRRKHWEELADTVVSSAYCGEAPGVDAGSLREPTATSKVSPTPNPELTILALTQGGVQISHLVVHCCGADEVAVGGATGCGLSH